MGLSGGSTTQKYTPSPQQTQAANTLTSAYSAAAPGIQKTADQLSALVPGLASNITGTEQGVGEASGYLNDVLGGKYLNAGNPYLSGMISSTDNDVTDRVNSQFGAAGRTGSGANTYALARGLGDSENNLRYSDYNSQLGRMDTAAANASTLNSQSLASLLGLATTASGLPLNAAQQYAGGIGSLGIGGTTTKSEQPSVASDIGTALQLGSLIFSDPRLKTDKEKLGEAEDGLGIYSYRYKGGDQQQVGVMADEVAKKRPWALGPKVNGYATVNPRAL